MAYSLLLTMIISTALAIPISSPPLDMVVSMPELQQPRATELARRDVLGDLNNLLGLLSNPVDSVGKKVDSLNTGNDDTQSSAAVIPVGDDQSSIAQLSSANRDFDQSFGNFMNGVQQTGDGLGRAVVSILEPVLAPLAAVIPLAGISNFDASASGSDESINFRHGSHFDENADPDISSSGVSSKQASIPSDQITNSNTNNDNGITGGDIASGTFPTIQVSDPAAANTTEPQSTTPANSNVAQPQSTLNGDGIAASLDGTQTNGSSTSSGQTAGIAIVPVKAGDQTGIAIIPVDSSSPQITAQVSANPQVGDGFISTATSDPTIAASPADGTSTNTDSANTQSVSNTTTSPTFPDGQHLVDKTPMGSGYLAPGIADALNATAINPAGIRIDGVSDIDNSVSSNLPPTTRTISANMTHTNRITSSGPKHSDSKGHIIDSTKTSKRSGAGKGNWGSALDDIDDLPSAFHLMKSRRRSNSQSQSFEREKMIQKFDAEELPEEVF